MEEWRNVVGYEGLYMVSSWGRVKSLNYRRTGKEGLLSPVPDKDGYKIIGLRKNGKRNWFKVHRLVAIAFIPNPDNLPEVNHKIDDYEHRSDNRVENLEWCTSKYNCNYGTHNKKLSENHADFSGDKNPTARKIKCITTGEVFNCMKDAEKKYGVAYQSISKCCRNKYKSAGKHPITGEKLVWEYYEGDK